MRIDSTCDPIRIDFTRDDRGPRVIPAIARLEGSRLTIALREDSVPVRGDGVYSERPTSFLPNETNGVSVFVLGPLAE